MAPPHDKPTIIRNEPTNINGENGLKRAVDISLIRRNLKHKKLRACTLSYPPGSACPVPLQAGKVLPLSLIHI